MGRRYPDPGRSHLRPCRCRFGSDRETQAVAPSLTLGRADLPEPTIRTVRRSEYPIPFIGSDDPPIEGRGSTRGSESLGSDSSTSSSGQTLTMHQTPSDLVIVPGSGDPGRHAGDHKEDRRQNQCRKRIGAWCGLASERLGLVRGQRDRCSQHGKADQRQD